MNRGALPATVQPALAAARRDEERLRADRCLAFESATKPPNCVYGIKDGAFTVALVGDSHAAAWFPALERLAKHEGWRLVTFVKVSCPFIDLRVRNAALKREYRECADFNAATLARLQTVRPDLTLVSISRIAIRPVDSRDDTVAAKGAAIGRMLARLPGRTAIIVDTPDAGRDIPACLLAHQDDVAACAIPRAAAFRDSLGDVESVAAKAGGGGRIDLTARICVGGEACPAVVNDMIVYRDADHMTATFSRSLAPALGLPSGTNSTIDVEGPAATRVLRGLESMFGWWRWGRVELPVQNPSPETTTSVSDGLSSTVRTNIGTLPDGPVTCP